MNLTMTDEQFNDAMEEASIAVQALVNTILFDRYGKREYTTAERSHELKVIMKLLEGYTEAVYIWNDFDIGVPKPYIPHGDE